jgi:hypothetical protein
MYSGKLIGAALAGLASADFKILTRYSATRIISRHGSCGEFAGGRTRYVERVRKIEGSRRSAG